MNARTRFIARIALLLLPLLVVSCASTPDPARNPFSSQYPEERPFPDSRFMSISSVRLHYRVWEPSQAAIGKIMLLPTEGGSTATYRLLAEQLVSAGYAVLAVDLPAFGFSSLATDFEHTFAARAGLLWSLADRIDTESNGFVPTRGWTLVGHGVGGQLAVVMAEQRAQRAEHLILIGSNVDDAANPSGFMWFPPVRWALRAWLNESIYTVEGVTELLSDAYGRPATEAEVALYAAPLLRDGMADAYINYRRTAGQTQFRLEELDVSVLLLAGDLDERVDPEVITRTADRIPDATYVIMDGAAHLPMETHVSETVEAMLSLISAATGEE